MAAATRKGVDPGLGIAAAAVYRKSVLAVGNGTVAEKNTSYLVPVAGKLAAQTVTAVAPEFLPLWLHTTIAGYG